jgi:hypothetical protein
MDRSLERAGVGGSAAVVVSISGGLRRGVRASETMTDPFERDLARLGRDVDLRWKRLENYPKWIRDYIHEVSAFDGAGQVRELTYLRDQNRALIKLVAELKAEVRRLQRAAAKSRRGK